MGSIENEPPGLKLPSIQHHPHNKKRRCYHVMPRLTRMFLSTCLYVALVVLLMHYVWHLNVNTPKSVTVLVFTQQQYYSGAVTRMKLTDLKFPSNASIAPFDPNSIQTATRGSQYLKFWSENPDFKVEPGRHSSNYSTQEKTVALLGHDPLDDVKDYNYDVKYNNNKKFVQVFITEFYKGNHSSGGTSMRGIIQGRHIDTTKTHPVHDTFKDSEILTACSFEDYFNGTYILHCPVFSPCVQLNISVQHLAFKQFQGVTKRLDLALLDKEICVSRKGVTYYHDRPKAYWIYLGNADSDKVTDTDTRAAEADKAKVVDDHHGVTGEYNEDNGGVDATKYKAEEQTAKQTGDEINGNNKTHVYNKTSGTENKTHTLKNQGEWQWYQDDRLYPMQNESEFCRLVDLMVRERFYMVGSSHMHLQHVYIMTVCLKHLPDLDQRFFFTYARWGTTIINGLETFTDTSWSGFWTLCNLRRPKVKHKTQGSLGESQKKLGTEEILQKLEYIKIHPTSDICMYQDNTQTGLLLQTGSWDLVYKGLEYSLLELMPRMSGTLGNLRSFMDTHPRVRAAVMGPPTFHPNGVYAENRNNDQIQLFNHVFREVSQQHGFKYVSVFDMMYPRFEHVTENNHYISCDFESCLNEVGIVAIQLAVAAIAEDK